MSFRRQIALATVKPMCRTLSAAPDPRLAARAIFAELAKVEDWSEGEEKIVTDFGQWLSERPPLASLKTQCQAVLAKLSADR